MSELSNSELQMKNIISQMHDDLNSRKKGENYFSKADIDECAADLDTYLEI